MSEQSNQLLSNDIKARSRNKEVSAIEKQMTDVTGKLYHSKRRIVTYEAHFESVRTALAMHKAVSQQHISNYVCERRRLAVGRAF